MTDDNAAMKPWPTNSHGTPHTPYRAEVDRIAYLLMDVWKRLDTSPEIAAHPVHIATFADMARAVVDDRKKIDNMESEPLSFTTLEGRIAYFVSGYLSTYFIVPYWSGSHVPGKREEGWNVTGEDSGVIIASFSAIGPAWALAQKLARAEYPVVEE